MSQEFERNVACPPVFLLGSIMLNITVLLENTLYNQNLQKAHGLSLLIRTPEQHILLDTGPNSKFYKNAKKLGIDLSQIDSLVLSHAHYDHTGGVNKFCKLNEKAQILMFSPYNEKYYGKSKIGYHFIGLKASAKNKKRITFLQNPLQITKHCWFIPCSVEFYGKPNKNLSLYKKVGKVYSNDTFNHEGILVYDDNGQLVIFNSCSHNGVINSIESVRAFFPNKKIRSYIGGFHFPYSSIDKIKPEDLRNLDELVDYANLQKDIIFYTGHCTGNGAFDYLRKALGERVQAIQTGKILDV